MRPSHPLRRCAEARRCGGKRSRTEGCAFNGTIARELAANAVFTSDEAKANIMRRTPTKRLGEPDEIADLGLTDHRRSQLPQRNNRQRGRTRTVLKTLWQLKLVVLQTFF